MFCALALLLVAVLLGRAGRGGAWSRWGWALVLVFVLAPLASSSLEWAFEGWSAPVPTLFQAFSQLLSLSVPVLAVALAIAPLERGGVPLPTPGTGVPVSSSPSSRTPVRPSPRSTPQAFVVSPAPTRVLSNGSRVYGVAGANISTAAFDDDLVAAGARGEQVLGVMLEEYAAKNPGTVVFHGLQFCPGRSGADVDHAVLAPSGQLFLLDAKNWRPGRYGFAADGTVHRALEGEPMGPFPGGEVHMGDARRRWEEYLRRQVAPWAWTQVVVAMVVLTRRDDDYEFDRRSHEGLLLETRDRAVMMVRALAACIPGDGVDPALELAIARCCQTLAGNPPLESGSPALAA